MKTILRPILALLSCIVLYICFAPTAFADTVASGACGASLRWVLDDKGTLTVSGQGEMYELNVLYDGGVFLSYSPWNDYNSSIKRIDIKNGVSTIASQAFANCDKAAEALIPASVTSIGDRAFAQCYSLSEINIPYGVISIGKSAFDSCTSALTIRLPESVTTIGEMAFDYCPKVTSLTIPSSVESIGDYAFSNLWALTEIVIPGNIKAVGHSVFNNCHALESVTISKGVESIGQYAFNADESLSRIVFEGSIPAIHEEAFRYVTADAFYPSGDSSYTAETMKDYGGTLTWIPYTSEDYVASGDCGADGDNLTWTLDANGLLTISGEGKMDDLDAWHTYKSSIISVVIEQGVTSIGSGAFANCYSLTSITIPKSVTGIGSGAFAECYNLTSVIIPESVTSIGDRTFLGCNNLTRVTIPESITAIGDSAFSGCNALTSVTIPENVTTIGWLAFSGCNSLTSVTIPEGVTSIGNYAFKDCNNLDGIWVSEENAVYSSDAYGVLFDTANSTLLQAPGKLSGEYTVPEGITDIGDWSFSGCSGLVSITISEDVTVMGIWVLSNCISLNSVTIPTGITSIERNSFYRCSSLTDVYYHGTREQWNEIYIDSGNDPLTRATLHCAKAEIIYNANGGYGIMDQQIVDIDASFNLRPNAFSRPEKIFLEWNTEPNGSGTSYLDQETISGISEGIVLYAQWGIVITFDANGGIGAMEPMIASGSNIVLPYNRFIREDYAFISWNTMPDGSGVSYLDAEMISLDELANLTLYAQWEKIAFTVMYIPNGGSGTMQTQKLIKGMSLTLQLNTFTRENYLFIGWSTTANGMVSYPDGDTINELFADISLYAQWVPVSSVDPDFVLPEELTAIGDEAFASGAFSYVKLSENTTSIGWHAFTDCPNLMYIYIPEKTTDIDLQAFGDRTELTILGKTGSTAETYATAHGYTFVAVS